VWAGGLAVQVFEEDAFPASALTAAEQLMQSIALHESATQLARARHQELHVAAIRDLDDLVTRIVSGRPLRRIDAASATNGA
jgi:hypothetical protein